MNRLNYVVTFLIYSLLFFTIDSLPGYTDFESPKVGLRQSIPSLEDQISSNLRHLIPLISELTGPVLVKPALIATFFNYKNCMKTLRFNKCSSKVIGTSENGSISVWDIEKGQRSRAFSSRAGYLDAAFADDGESILTKGDDQNIMVWQKKDDRYLQPKRASGHMPEVESNPFIRLFYSGKDNAVHFVEKETGQCRMVLPAHDKKIEVAEFNDDFSLLVTSGCDQRIRVWRVGKTPQEIMGEVALWYKVKKFFCRIL